MDEFRNTIPMGSHIKTLCLSHFHTLLHCRLRPRKNKVQQCGGWGGVGVQLQGAKRSNWTTCHLHLYLHCLFQLTAVLAQLGQNQPKGRVIAEKTVF